MYARPRPLALVLSAPIPLKRFKRIVQTRKIMVTGVPEEWSENLFSGRELGFLTRDPGYRSNVRSRHLPLLTHLLSNVL